MCQMLIMLVKWYHFIMCVLSYPFDWTIYCLWYSVKEVDDWYLFS